MAPSVGYGDQYVRYNATTGKVEFGSGVSLNWVGATYIDKDGVFTGTLSADTIKTLISIWCFRNYANAWYESFYFNLGNTYRQRRSSLRVLRLRKRESWDADWQSPPR